MVFFSRGASLKFIQTKRNDTTVVHGGFGFIQRRLYLGEEVHSDPFHQSIHS